MGKSFRIACLTMLVLGVVAVASAQSPDPPLAGRPANFSHLIGRFAIAVEVEPTTVVVEDPLTVRVKISGAVAAGDAPSRQYLRLFPDDVSESFFLEPRPEDDRWNPDDRTWNFVWKLRPKSVDVREVPSLALSYYSPTLRRYQTVLSDSIPIDVKPRPSSKMNDASPREIAEQFLRLAPWEAEMPSGGRPWGLLESVIAATILAMLGAVYGNRLARRSTPDGSGSLAESAITALRCHPSDPAEVFTLYLRSRHGLASVEPSIDEIDALLKRQDVSPELRQRLKRWYAVSRERRFGPALAETDPSHLNEGIEIIRRIEGWR